MIRRPMPLLAAGVLAFSLLAAPAVASRVYPTPDPEGASA